MSVATRPQTALPTPQERPDAALVVFDADCRMCSAQVRLFKRFDWRRRLAFISLHDPEVYRRFPDLEHDQLMQQILVVTLDGRRYWGAAAVRYIAGQLPMLWPVAAAMYVPGSLPVWRWLYLQVAKRRYRFGKVGACEDGACAVHLRGK